MVYFVEDLLGGQLAFSPVVVHSVVGDSSKLPAAVVFIVDVVRHVLQVLHVSSGDTEVKMFKMHTVSAATQSKLNLKWFVLLYKNPLSEDLHCSSEKPLGLIEVLLTVNDKGFLSSLSLSVPDEHVPEDGEVTVVTVFN